ncbi:hypothetical protein BABINDRAFT_171322 [Babjeviella inositovora NRRL Y-12698]|uniref:CAAX prenyl protease n=1 Tax=Babjeviella inositovora NRRL Y-12698 TaxID=984486 RepID=A0A1E3QRW6_9ASCO|nr:uncharacterized protein BABINDRAFT_171322 [Babjeviella inositovora NRRL Y-12698]ODQ80435.1 hypothetical protein BABINDRAFT_171322 [Babjeviella inositovora NRRL Y-12698]
MSPPLSIIANGVNSPELNWRQIILSLSTANFIFKSYMNLCQFGVLRRAKPPKALEADATQDTYDKSRAYALDKIKHTIALNIWLYCEDLVYIKFNVYLALWQAPVRASSILGFATGEITQSVILVVIYSIITQTLMAFPLKYYRGSNNPTFSQWLMNELKENIILLVLVSLLTAVTLKVVELAGDLFIWYTWLFIEIIFVAVKILYPYLILPLFHKSKPLDSGKLKDFIDRLAHEKKFPLNSVNVIDGSKNSSHSNAFFTGLPWSKHIFLHDTMVDKFGVEEAAAVLVHEIGHWELNHTLIVTVYEQFQLLLILFVFSLFSNNPYLYSSFGFGNHTPACVKFMILCYFLTPMNCALQFLSNVLTRKNEYEADAYVVSLNYEEHIAAALIKLNKDNKAVLDTHWLYSTYHHSHPLLQERLKAIKHLSSKEK